MQEEFVCLKNFPRYFINKEGRIFDSLSNRYLTVTFKTTGDDYPAVMLCKQNKKITRRRIHRLLAETFLPNPQNKKCINHIDGNKQNYSLPNLEWCDHSHNLSHAYAKKLRLRQNHIKDFNPNVKLNSLQVKQIRALKASGIQSSVLAKMFNVSYSNIYSIVNNHTWKE